MDSPINNIQLRTFEKLTWVDPKQVLINLRHIELNNLLDLDEKTKRLRTNKLKIWRESRDAALFTYGINSFVSTFTFVNRIVCLNKPNFHRFLNIFQIGTS